MELVQAAATLPGPLPVLLPAGTLEVQRQQLRPRLGDWNLGRGHQTGDKIALPIAKMGRAHSEGGNGTAGRHPAPAVLTLSPNAPPLRGRQECPRSPQRLGSNF